MDEAAARRAFEDALTTYQQDFGTFFLARLLGLEISYPSYPGDTCVVAFRPAEFLFNPQGTLHGGVIATVMDISMGHLLHHATGGPGATLEMKVQYLRPPGAGTLTCTGRFLRQGRRVSFLASELRDGDGELVALATATWSSPMGTSDRP
ncbi:MAG TPA: PaaI family thioesterase [Candidatus Saccharimonadales bacterium]|nr:PaaI family thioesterase [Candidatus Saccharimonadales bacterium]